MSGIGAVAPRRAAALAALSLLVLTGCGTSDDGADTTSVPAPAADRLTGAITVSAAASLTGVFTAIGD